MNLKKVILVVVITALIWVWADRAQNEELDNVPASVYVDQTANPGLWVTLDKELSVPIKITLSGPVSKIEEVKRKLKSKDSAKDLPFDFKFDAKAEGFDKPGVPSILDLLGFLQKNKDVIRLGLKIESVNPSGLSVKVKRLIKQKLAVECVDEAGSALSTEYIEPKHVEMLVPEFWQNELLKARVQLTKPLIEQATAAPVKVKPYVEIAPGVLKYADTEVEIKVHPIEEKLKEYQIPATIGFTCSENLLGKFSVSLNRSQLPSTVKIKATLEAKTRYESRSFKLLLVIEDEDLKATEPLLRELVYNFPAEFVQKNEIKQIQDPPRVKFELIPASVPAESASNP